jgi:hypothetical protein
VTHLAKIRCAFGASAADPFRADRWLRQATCSKGDRPAWPGPLSHIYDDRDPFNDGEGEFWFQVYNGSPPQRVMIEQFHRVR